MERRNTIQRDLVFEAVKTLGNHPTADEVYLHIKENHPSIGRGTVYRNLNILADDNKILKIQTPAGPDHFDHNVHRHFHVRCVECDKINDIDLKNIPDIMGMIENTNGMKIIDFDILFKGTCPSCLDRK